MLYVTQYLYKYKLRDDAYLLLNTLTGALDVVTDRLNQLLAPRAAIDPAALEPDEAQMLVDRGYLLGQDEDRAQVKKWFADFKDSLRSWHFIVCPTFTCNLRCTYCYESLEIRESKIAQTPEQVAHMFQAMDALVAERDAKFVQIELYGGEPFLKPNRHVVESIMREAHAKGWGIAGITNATQIESYFDLFEELPGAVHQLQITMDGPKPVHNKLRVYAGGRGTYEEICENVTGVLDRGVAVVLRVNTGIDNVQNLPALLQAFEDMGWTKHQHFACLLAPITDHLCSGCVPNYQPEFKLLAQLHELFEDWEATRDRYHIILGYDLERRTSLLRKSIFGKAAPTVSKPNLAGCSASNQHYLVFGADGMLYACPETVGITETAIGTFTPEFTIDRSRWAKWDLNISNTSKCADCNIAPVCGGACPWQGFNASSFDAYKPHCNYAHQTLNAYLDVNKKHILTLLDSE